MYFLFLINYNSGNNKIMDIKYLQQNPYWWVFMNRFILYAKIKSSRN